MSKRSRGRTAKKLRYPSVLLILPWSNEGEHVFDPKDIERDLPVRVGLRLADTETSERIEFLLRGRLLPNKMIGIPADAYHNSSESGLR